MNTQDFERIDPATGQPYLRRHKIAGGPRPGVGRHKVSDKIVMVPISVRSSRVNSLGRTNIKKMAEDYINSIPLDIIR